MPTRWGILATGNIAHSFATNLHDVPDAVIGAVGSRSRDSAEAFARELGDEQTHVHGSYDALVADPDVDVVYIASPHSHHLEHARLAFAAGKPVLCEKPVAVTRADGQALFDSANGLFCMEAMWMACHPLVVDMGRRLAAGEFGTPRQAHADLGFVVPADASARMWDPALGAGALLDMGIYPLTFARLMLGPFATVAAAGTLADSGIDLDVAVAARHENGAVSALTTSMTSASPRTATVATDQGLLALPVGLPPPGVRRVDADRRRAAAVRAALAGARAPGWGTRRPTCRTACATGCPRARWSPTPRPWSCSA